MVPRESKNGSMMSCEPSAKMTCSDWFLLSWKSVIFSLAMAVKSIFTVPVETRMKDIGVAGLRLGELDDLNRIGAGIGVRASLRDNKRTVHDYLPRAQFFGGRITAIQIC